MFPPISSPFIKTLILTKPSYRFTVRVCCLLIGLLMWYNSCIAEGCFYERMARRNQGIRRSSRFTNTSLGNFKNTEEAPVNIDDDDEIVVTQPRDTKKSKLTKDVGEGDDFMNTNKHASGRDNKRKSLEKGIKIDDEKAAVKSKKPKFDVWAKGKAVLEETTESSDESDDDIDGTNFCMQSDEDTRSVKVQLDNKKICMFKSRCTPYRLYHALSQINERHKEAIWNLGFGKMLDLNMYEIPSRSGEWLVDAFDPLSYTLRTKDGALKIRAHDVHQISGIPIGGQRILMERRVDYSREIVMSWRMRYGITNSAISVTKIMDKMIQSTRPDKWFLLDFLVLFTTTMVEGIKNGMSNQRILTVVDRPENAIKFDWSRSVVDSMCSAKITHSNTKDIGCFVGPSASLRSGERSSPRAQVNTRMRSNPGTSGKTRVQPKSVSAADPNSSSTSKRIGKTETNTKEDVRNEDDNSEQHIHHADHPTAESQSVEETFLQLSKMVRTMLQMRKEYDIQLVDALNKFLDSRDIRQLHIDFKNSMSGPVETQVYWRDPRVHERTEENEKAVAQQNKQKDKGKEPTVTELTSQANVQKRRGPGITIREPTPMQEDPVTPYGDKLGRGHREKKAAITLRSPFTGRMVNVNEKISRDEDNVCDWIYAIRETGTELYFAWRDVKVMRSEFESFSDGYHIKPVVVDAWSVVLNHRENLRSPQSPLRFYCTTAISSKCLLWRGKSTTQMDNEFNKNIDIDLRRFSHVKLLDIDMMFIPVLIEKHYYLIVFDLKTPCMELLDNNAGSLLQFVA
uniref:Ubiquitin-like protease family profile domain-containing protein n=1 Tax=Kalanchoe fedtschenkoi TaxID=63787 RepID=A0A7N0U5R1_KALFE